MEIGDDFFIFYLFFYFWPEEPAAPVLTSPADSLRDSRHGPRRGRTQQAGAAPYGLVAALLKANTKRVWYSKYLGFPR